MLTKDQYAEQMDDNGIIACVCGGDNGSCWCPECVDTAQQLLAGERRAVLLDLFNVPALVVWSITDGLRK